MKKRLYLFDLDGTLLRSDKTISPNTIYEISNLRNKGNLIGVSTSRGEWNCRSFLGELKPDILVVSGGALVKKADEYIFKAVFSIERTRELIQTARSICGDSCEITIDTIDKHYWNYKVDPKKQDESWGDSIWTDFSDFDEEALKMCVEIFDDEKAGQLEASLTDCDAARFSDGFWYKYTKKGVSKENSIRIVCDACGISEDDIVAFGDDYADIGMLKMAGIGVAMGNAIKEVKDIADVVIGTNDEDGIANYLNELESLSITVRFAKENELNRINELRKQVNDIHVAGKPEVFKAGFSDELRDHIHTIWNDPDQRIVVAELAGTICGFAVLHHIRRGETPFMYERDYMDIDEFCVDISYRRQGVASQMISFIRDHAKKQGFKRLELNMWEFNEDALAFYEAAGFKTYRRYMEMNI